MPLSLSWYLNRQEVWCLPTDRSTKGKKITQTGLDLWVHIKIFQHSKNIAVFTWQLKCTRPQHTLTCISSQVNSEICVYVCVSLSWVGIMSYLSIRQVPVKIYEYSRTPGGSAAAPGIAALQCTRCFCEVLFLLLLKVNRCKEERRDTWTLLVICGHSPVSSIFTQRGDHRSHPATTDILSFLFQKIRWK